MSTFPDKGFLSLIASLFISKLGDYAFEVVFVLIVLETTHNNYLYVGVVYFFRFIPFLFFGPLGGWLADNASLRRTLITSELVRLCTLIMLFMIYAFGTINIYVLIATSVLTTIGRSLFQPSFQTAIPQMVSPTHLTRANSVTQIAEESASIAGPLICSLLMIYQGKALVLFFNAATYFLSAIILLFVTLETSSSKGSLQVAKIYRENRDYIKNLYKNNNQLYVSVVGSSLCILFTGSLLRFILPAFILKETGSEIQISYAFSVIAAGTIFAGVLYSKVIKSVTAPMLMAFWATYGLVMISLPLFFLYSPPLIFVLCFLLGICGALVDITLVSVIQSLSEQGSMGKTFGAFSTMANTAEAASGLLSGLFAMLGLFISFTCMAGMIVLAGTYGFIRMKKKRTN
ncbi:MFS transporter [Enterobacteriaceae bacterium H11S18]|uniref:MFS transporter n=1 Tax=Dryocola clanedunensis TaxID=2925396 RepID=UPI0022F0A853|nr:MFS transporter [Dryocola clanedunensis]MCT4708838.1 MFS transporter [Dryocola clanedunensis]